MESTRAVSTDQLIKLYPAELRFCRRKDYYSVTSLILVSAGIISTNTSRTAVLLILPTPSLAIASILCIPFELNISSTKSMTGHLLGAAGAVESIASILAIKNGIVPPTINHEEGDNDENIDYNLNFTFNKAQKRDVNVALSNTFGFGGHNACVIFKKYAE